ncbi:MAG: hypothetical protein HZA16_00990 [Nitrospirae bacterium]|nr:hypothetical protein [Nitrospirota bacterium]
MNKTICAICAWRATCKKQFSMSGDVKCADYVRDVSIKEEKEEDEGKKTPDPEKSK